MMEQAAGIARTTHAVGERVPVRGAVLHHASEDAVCLEQRIGFAGHVRREADDPALLDLDPLAVGAGQTNHVPARTELVEHAEDLRFLAANYIRDPGFIAAGDAGRDPHLATRPRNLAHARDNLIEAGGTGCVRHLEPALAAADHAAHDYLRLARGDPIAGLLFQYARVIPPLDRKNSRRRGPRIDDRAAGVEPVGAEGGGAPVNGEHESRD